MKQLLARLIGRVLQTRPVVLAFAPILGALAIVVLLAATPTWVSAQGTGPTSCKEAMSVDSAYLDLQFSAGITVTKPALRVANGQILCVETAFTTTVAFKADGDFYLNGRHFNYSVTPSEYRDLADISPGFSTFLVTGSDVDTLIHMVDPPEDMLVDIYVGQFGPIAVSPVATPAPTPIPPRPWVYVSLPYSVDYRSGPPSFEFIEDGITQIQLRATVPFSLTDVSGSDTYTATADLSSGWILFVADIEDGKWEAPALNGLWWQARFDAATAGTVFRMRSPMAPAATAGGKINLWKSASGKFYTDAKCTGVAVVFDPARHVLEGSCGGGSGAIWSPAAVATIGPARPRGWGLN